MMTTSLEYSRRRQQYAIAMKAKGLVRWKGKEWISKDEFERRYQELLALGRAGDEEYRKKLIQMYGKVPDWAPHRIPR